MAAVKDGMIRSVTVAAVRPPDSAAVIDGAGRTLLPGLIDAHVHIGHEETLEQAAALGVTTVLDMWGDPSTLIPLKKKIEQGEHPNAADFRTAGTGATVPRGHPTQIAGPKFPTLGADDDVEAFVDARFAEGSDYLKIFYYTPISLKFLETAVVTHALSTPTLSIIQALSGKPTRSALATHPSFEP